MIGKHILAVGIATVFLGCAGCTAQERATFASNHFASAADDSDARPSSDDPFPPPPPTPDLPKMDPLNGHILNPIGSGAYSDPFTGTLYAPMGGGTVVNTQTGQLVPG
jgi:hypothetical protein